MDRMATCDFLLIGCEGCGKTTLLKQLSNMCKNIETESSMLNTIPTNGVELETISYKKHKYVVREIGGNFLPVWPKYYESCLMVIFMVDMANLAQLSITWVEFLNLLSHKGLYKKSVLLLLNKIDQPYAMDRHLLQHVLHIDAALKEAYARFGQAIWVEEVSAAKGTGLDKVLGWMYDTKRTTAHASPAPSSSTPPPGAHRSSPSPTNTKANSSEKTGDGYNPNVSISNVNVSTINDKNTTHNTSTTNLSSPIPSTNTTTIFNMFNTTNPKENNNNTNKSTSAPIPAINISTSNNINLDTNNATT